MLITPTRGPLKPANLLTLHDYLNSQLGTCLTACLNRVVCWKWREGRREGERERFTRLLFFCLGGRAKLTSVAPFLFSHCNRNGTEEGLAVGIATKKRREEEQGQRDQEKERERERGRERRREEQQHSQAQ